MDGEIILDRKNTNVMKLDDNEQALMNEIEIDVPRRQPVKKQITYDLDRGLNDGEHTLDIRIIDRVGNQTDRSIYFTCK